MRDFLLSLGGAGPDTTLLLLLAVLTAVLSFAGSAAVWWWLEEGPADEFADDDDAARDETPGRGTLEAASGTRPLSVSAPRAGGAPRAAAPAPVWWCACCGAAYVDDAGCDDCGPTAPLRLDPPPRATLGPMVPLLDAYPPDRVEALRLELEAAAIPVELSDQGLPAYGSVFGPLGATTLLVPRQCLRRARALLAARSEACPPDPAQRPPGAST